MKSKNDFKEQIGKDISEGKKDIKELTSVLMRDTNNGYKAATAVLLTNLMCNTHRMIALTEVMIDIRDLLQEIHFDIQNLQNQMR